MLQILLGGLVWPGSCLVLLGLTVFSFVWLGLTLFDRVLIDLDGFGQV